jgi:enoyl-[acyl-carrier protein] reductase I
MLTIDLTGKKVLIIGIADDNGFGWAIAKKLHLAGAEIIAGTWVPLYKIFTNLLNSTKLDKSKKLENGGNLKFLKVYPIDASFDKKEDLPKEILENKRYMEYDNYCVEDFAKLIEKDVGKIDIVIHCLANAPEVKNPLLETSRKGYLSAINTSAYSLISFAKYFSPIMNTGGSFLSLTYIASTKAIPGYGGGMSSAKAALESDTKMLAYEIGQKYNLRINSISAGPIKSRAARAIGLIDDMIKYSKDNAPLSKELYPDEIASLAAFLSSDLASSITGSVIFADNGLHAMGMAKKINFTINDIRKPTNLLVG